MFATYAKKHLSEAGQTVVPEDPPCTNFRSTSLSALSCSLASNAACSALRARSRAAVMSFSWDSKSVTRSCCFWRERRADSLLSIFLLSCFSPSLLDRFPRVPCLRRSYSCALEAGGDPGSALCDLNTGVKLGRKPLSRKLFSCSAARLRNVAPENDRCRSRLSECDGLVDFAGVNMHRNFSTAASNSGVTAAFKLPGGEARPRLVTL